MNTKKGSFGAVVLSLSLIFPWPAPARQAVGIVTALKGKGHLTRSGTQKGLQFKDDVILRDLIDTREKSLARILFGGKSTVTVRELSRLEVREENLPTGAVRSVHELSSGGILVNVARSLLRPGDEVQIRTPNAVAAVRGTTIFAQFNPQLAQTVFTVLTGSAEVTPQGLPAISLTPNTAVNVTGDQSAGGVQAGPVQVVTQSAGTAILQASEPGVAVTEGAEQEQTAQAQTEQAVLLANAVVEAITGETATTSSETEQLVQDTAQEIESGTAEPETTTSTQTSETSVITAPVTAGGTGDVEPVVLPRVFDTTRTFSRNPLIEVGSKFVVKQTEAGKSLIRVNPDVTATLDGQLLKSTGSTLSTLGALLAVRGTLKGTGTEAFTLLDGAAVTVGTDLVTINGGTLDIGGRLLSITGGSLKFGSTSLLKLASGATLKTGGSLLDSTNLTLDLGSGAIMDVSGESTVENSAGPFIKATGGSLTADALVETDEGGNTFKISGTILDLKNTTMTLRVIEDEPSITDADTLRFTLAADEPFYRLDNSTLKITESGGLEELTVLDGDEIGSIFPGRALIADNNSRITNNNGGLLVLEGTFTAATEAPLVQITDSSVSTFEQAMFFVLSKPLGSSAVTLRGPLVQGTNATFTSGPPLNRRTFLAVRNPGNSLKSTGLDPLVILSSSTVRGRRFVDVRDTGKLELAGPLLRDSGGSFTTQADFARVAQLGKLIDTGTGPLFRFTNSTLNIGTDALDPDGRERQDNFFRVDDSAGGVFKGLSEVTLAGPLVQDTSSTFTIADDFLRVVDDSRLTSTTTSPLMQLTGTTTNVKGDFIRIDDSAKVTLSGTLLKAGSTLDIGTDPTGAGDLVDIRTDGQLVVNSSGPVILFDGGTHTIGTNDTSANDTGNRMFRLRGNTVDSGTGLGTDQPVKGSEASFTVGSATANNPIGALFEATGGADISVQAGSGDTTGGHAIELDTALFEATLPVFDLVGSTTAASTITTADAFAEINKSKVIVKGPFISLDKGLIKVNNGPLLNLRGGSETDVSGDLLQLVNGSTINVVNGPLIKADGSGTLLKVTGALVNFGGSGGNKVIVRNNLCLSVCSQSGGVNILVQSGGSVNISGTAIKNTTLGTLDVGSQDAVIEAANSGTVDIQGN